jgi:SAM-dependent methyltransferase
MGSFLTYYPRDFYLFFQIYVIIFLQPKGITMADIIESKGWDWKIVSDNIADVWKNPAPETYYLLHRWKQQNKKTFLDLGCGLGRHCILFGLNGFDVSAFDISENAIERTGAWAKELGINLELKQGDMLNVPFTDNSMDCILCMNVISHTDTNGVHKIANELKRVLKSGGECYFTLASKETWGFKQNWPVVDENTKLRDEPGPEYMVPHFYADRDAILKIFCDFEIIETKHIGTYITKDDKTFESYHWHVLIRKK